jgi:nucleoid-associated protein YgaU
MSTVIRLPKGSTDRGIVDVAEPTTLGARTRPGIGTRVANLTPPIGWARLTAEDTPALTVLCELGANVPPVTQGYAEWEEVDRKKRISLTNWTGYKPMAVELPLWLDDITNERSVEDAIAIIEAFAGRGKRRAGYNRGSDYSEPPKLIVHTAGVMPYDAQAFPSMRWVVQDLDWDDDEAITNDHGNRIRAPVVMHLLQYVTDTRLQDRSLAAAQRRAGRIPVRHVYTVRAGDTLPSIARKKLGDPGRWVEIARLNDIRDPRALKPGARLRIP